MKRGNAKRAAMTAGQSRIRSWARHQDIFVVVHWPPGLRHRPCRPRHWCPRRVRIQKPRPTVPTTVVLQEKNAIKGRGLGRGKARSEQPPTATHGSRSKPATRPEACGGAAAPRRRRRNARPAPRASTTASWSRRRAFTRVRSMPSTVATKPAKR